MASRGSAFVRVETTFPASPRAALDRFVRGAVEGRLAACANVAPGLQSVYWWDGKVERAREVLVSFKTTRAASTRLVAWVRAVHPYDVPYVAAEPVTIRDPGYARWLRAEVRPGPAPGRPRGPGRR